MNRLCVAMVLVWSALGLGVSSRVAYGDKATPLLEDDLRANKRKTIDAPADAADADLDAVLGGPSGFSTQELGKVEDRLRAELQRDRPRASPRLVVFLYPGRVSAERLKAMREVNVDMELTIDPCSRTVCDDALARHVEIVGRAVGNAVLKAQNFSILYKTLTLKAETDVRGEELITLTVPMADAVAASQKPGGGRALLEARRHADTDYVPLMTKAIAQRAAARRVPLDGPPNVARANGSVDIGLKLRGDRSRQDQQVLDALAATAEALGSSPATPSQGRIEVDIEAASRSVGPARFRSPLDPALRYSQGQLDGKELMSSYVEHVNDDKNAQHMSLGDEPGADEGGAAPDDSEAINQISSHFASVGACAKTEAASNSRFHGVTVVIGWAPSGQAASIDVKEPALRGGALPGCLKRAFVNIPLPRFSGSTRTIEYPIRLK